VDTQIVTERIGTYARDDGAFAEALKQIIRIDRIVVPEEARHRLRANVMLVEITESSQVAHNTGTVWRQETKSSRIWNVLTRRF
jgi:hypothetical protein